MSAFSLAEGGGGVVGAWETAGQVYRARLDGVRSAPPTAAPGSGARKYPVALEGAGGRALFAWVDGAGWERGGKLSWRVYDRGGSVLGGTDGAADVPTWSLVSAVARPDGTFLLIY